MIKLLIVVAASFLFLGCSHSFNSKNMILVDHSIEFSQVQRDPHLFIGRTIIVGGVVAAVHTTGEGAVLEVVQYDLDAGHVPDDAAGPKGHFLATTPEAGAIAACRPGQLLTVIGEVKGKELRHGDAQTYIYPIITIREMHIWNNGDPDRYPVLPGHFDPYYWGYPNEQHLNRPTGPTLKRF